MRVQTKVRRGGDGDACLDGIVITLEEPLGERRVVEEVTDRTLTVQRE